MNSNLLQKKFRTGVEKDNLFLIVSLDLADKQNEQV